MEKGSILFAVVITVALLMLAAGIWLFIWCLQAEHQGVLMSLGRSIHARAV